MNGPVRQRHHIPSAIRGVSRAMSARPVVQTLEVRPMRVPFLRLAAAGLLALAFAMPVDAGGSKVEIVLYVDNGSETFEADGGSARPAPRSRAASSSPAAAGPARTTSSRPSTAPTARAPW
jgi:hypothetical protein